MEGGREAITKETLPAVIDVSRSSAGSAGVLGVV